MAKLKLLSLLYSILITLSLPLAVLRLLWKSKKNTHYSKRISERFAINLPQKKGMIWIHTVSVGEFLATLPLIQQLLDDNYKLLVTTTTPTGSAMLKQRLGEQVTHCYLPFDAPFLVHRFIRQTRPSVAVFVETEIWPNYLQTLKKQNIPSLLINARLSEKSFLNYNKLGQFSRYIIACFTEIACQNKSSQQRFQNLGGHATMLGNIKFDLTKPDNLAEKQKKISTLLGKKPFILAASTHKGEDEIILQSFKNSRYSATHRLVIAPRHPERSSDILAICQTNQSIATRYSQTENTLPPDIQILIIDTLGEMLYFYSLADFAVIGGSFIKHGGHNPLEAALFATPCLIGEHYFNFESLVNEMLQADAITVTNAKKLFQHQDELAAIGKNAQNFLAKNQGSMTKYATLIKQSAQT